MTIRAFYPRDIAELKRIHAKYFANEFCLPDFLKYVCAFTIEDEQGILTMGGIRNIAECILVTNKDRDILPRSKALYQMLDACTFVTKKSGYDQIYAWSQNPGWTRRLRKEGFRSPVGDSLILDL